MKNFLYHFLLIVTILVAASCSSTRNVKKMPMVGGLTGVEYVEKIIASAPEWSSLSGKASLELVLGKNERARVNASLRIYRGEAILLSVAPVLGIEVARLELTPQGLLLVDRINKRFVRTSFSEVSELLRVDLNFHILQSLFMNEIFLPQKKMLGIEDATSFTLMAEEHHAKIEPKKMKRIGYHFYTSSDDGSLQKTVIGLKGTDFSLNWVYGDFSPLERRLFPRRSNVNLQGLTETYALNLKMSRLSVGGKWNGSTKLSSKYKEISLQEILKILFKL